MGQWCTLFRRSPNLPPGLYGAGVQAVYSGFGIYLLGTVRQGCRLFKRCLFQHPEQVRRVELDIILILFEDSSDEACAHAIAFV